MFFLPRIHILVQNIFSIRLVTYWLSKGVVKYEYVMTMGCAEAQNPFLQNQFSGTCAAAVPGMSPTQGLWYSTFTSGISMDYLLIRGVLHPTPFVGDAGVHRNVVVQIERID